MISRKVDVGGVQLFVRDSGRGWPAIVLVSGAGGFSSTWAGVAAELAPFARVISYDRAGYGGSDPLPHGTPATAERAADELAALLRTLSLTEPAILVGYTYGGMVTRLCAARHPQLVAGMVLVESWHEDEWTDRWPDVHRKRLKATTSMLGWMSRLSPLGIPKWLDKTIGTRPLESLPVALKRLLVELGYAPKTVRTMYAELAHLEESAAQVRGAAPTLDDLPLVVVRRGKLSIPGLDKVDLVEKLQEAMIASQDSLARTSTRGTVLVADRSVYDVPIEQPLVIVDAVRQVIAQVRPAPETSSSANG